MASGAAWMVGFKLVERSLGLISTLVLVRVLVPNDFGTVAMAMSFSTLIQLTTAFGFDIALIQRRTTDRKYWDTAWTLDALFGVSVGLVMAALAPAVSSFYRHPELTDVVRVLALCPVISGFGNIGVVAFRTEMRFDREFRFLLAKKLISVCITIPAAIYLKSYWALVIGQTCGALLGTILSYWVHSYRPRFSLEAAGQLFGFSKWMLVLNLVNYVKERSHDWVIGRTAGAASLGIYNISLELASLPSTELAAPINRAILPAYVQIASDRVRLSREYLDVMAMITLLALPAISGLAATADLVVQVMLGEKWASAAPIMTLLCLYGITQVLQSNAQSVYFVLGRPDVPVKLNAVHGVLKVVAMAVLTSKYGLIGAALAAVFTAVIMIPTSLSVAFRMLKIRTVDFVREVWRPLLAATLMYGLVRGLLAHIESMRPEPLPIAQLALAATLGATSYVGLILLLWRLCGSPTGAERTALEVARRALIRVRGSATWRQ